MLRVVRRRGAFNAGVRQRRAMEIARTSGDSFKKLGWQARGYARVDAFAVRADRFCTVINLRVD